MSAPTSTGGSHIDVRREDQIRINRFSTLNRRVMELKEDALERDQALQDVSDAADELLIGDDDSETVKFLFGDAYIEVPRDDADGLLEAKTVVLEASKGADDDEIDGIKTEMAALKVELYARFGKQINLED